MTDTGTIPEGSPNGEPHIYRGTPGVRRFWTMLGVVLIACGLSLPLWDTGFGLPASLVLGFALAAMGAFSILETQVAHTALYPDSIVTKSRFISSLSRNLMRRDIASKRVSRRYGVTTYAIYSKHPNTPPVTFGTYPGEEDDYFRAWMRDIPDR